MAFETTCVTKDNDRPDIMLFLEPDFDAVGMIMRYPCGFNQFIVINEAIAVSYDDPVIKLTIQKIQKDHEEDCKETAKEMGVELSA